MVLFNENDINKLYKDYLDYLSTDRGLEKVTVERYKKVIERLLYECVLNKIENSKEGYTKIITQENCDSLPTRKFGQPAYTNFGLFLYHTERIDKNYKIDEIINRYKLGKAIIKSEFSHKTFEYDYLGDEILYRDTEERVRTKACLALSYYCMFNQQELADLKVVDIDFKNKRIRNLNVPKKKSKKVVFFYEWILINDKLITVLQDYLNFMKDNSKSYLEQDYFFMYDRKILKREKVFDEYIKPFRENCGFEFKGAYGSLRTNFMYNYLEETNGKGLITLIGTVGMGDANLNSVCNMYFQNEEFMNVANYTDLNETRISDKEIEEIKDLENVQIDRNTNKNKIEILAEKLVRNKNYVDMLKSYYDNTCQVCGKKLQIGINEYYSEVHHIQPYNKSTDGDDKLENMIVLCPDCHKQFDRNYLAINPETLGVYYYQGGEILEKTKKIVIDESLKLGDEYLEYAWQTFLNK